MTDREALLRAVCENPDDDLPRLVFADWLEEHDEPERAEFIRVQVELATTEFACTDAERLATRQIDLWTRYKKFFRDELPILPGVEWPSDWKRGFASIVTIDSFRDFAIHQKAVLYSAPVQHVELWDAIGFGQFANAPLVRPIRSLTIRRPRFTDTMAKHLLNNPEIGPITCIDLRNQLLTPEMALLLQSRLRNRVLV